MTQSDRPSSEDDVPPSHSQWHGFGSPRFTLAAILIAMAAGAGAYRLLANSWGGPERVQRPQAEANAPLFVKDGQRIIVPQGSPLRSRLVVANVLSKEVSRKLVLPAMVEAEPARTVKVLPPVAGRVVALK